MNITLSFHITDSRGNGDGDGDSDDIAALEEAGVMLRIQAGVVKDEDEETSQRYNRVATLIHNLLITHGFHSVVFEFDDVD